MAKEKTQEGFAALHVGKVHGASTVLASRSRSPVCLLTPRPRGPSVWAYTSSLGGGMVAGDTVQIDLTIDPAAVCFLGTQASSKIYRNPAGRPCSHRLEASIAEEATLILAPDPVQCFAEASYTQHQVFNLTPAANLILVDWISAGRLARGERWSFQRYFSRNEIRRHGQPIAIDAIDLDATSGSLTNRFRAGRFNCLATLFLFGPRLQVPVQDCLAAIASMPNNPEASFVVAASPVQEGIILRCAGSSVEETGRVLAQHLRFVHALLDDDPWARKW